MVSVFQFLAQRIFDDLLMLVNMVSISSEVLRRLFTYQCPKQNIWLHSIRNITLLLFTSDLFTFDDKGRVEKDCQPRTVKIRYLFAHIKRKAQIPSDVNHLLSSEETRLKTSFQPSGKGNVKIIAKTGKLLLRLFSSVVRTVLSIGRGIIDFWNICID